MIQAKKMRNYENSLSERSRRSWSRTPWSRMLATITASVHIELQETNMPSKYAKDFMGGESGWD